MSFVVPARRQSRTPHTSSQPHPLQRLTSSQRSWLRKLSNRVLCMLMLVLYSLQVGRLTRGSPAGAAQSGLGRPASGILTLALLQGSLLSVAPAAAAPTSGSRAPPRPQRPSQWRRGGLKLSCPFPPRPPAPRCWWSLAVVARETRVQLRTSSCLKKFS